MTLTESYPQMSIFKTPWQLEAVDCSTARKFCKKVLTTKSLSTFSNLQYSIVLQSCQLPVKKGSINGLHVIKLPTNFVRLYKLKELF